MAQKLKNVFWWTLDHLPFHLRYYILFIYQKKRLPRFLCPKDYCDYVTSDNFFGRHKKHAFLADKLEVRKYVEEKGLGDTLVPLLGYWDDASKVDFDALPNQFAIKCNHSCGMNIICFDKSKLDIEDARAKLDKWMHTKHPKFFERHYKYIKPMILAEALIPSEEDGYFPRDYKIHCAHGKPVYIQCCFERTDNDAGRRVIYSTEWKNLHYVIADAHYSEEDIPRPKHLEEMLKGAKKLSEGLDYARIDFYDTDKGILFGEVTLTPMGGWLEYFTQEALDVMGKAIREGKQKK